jgi:hypothetical protein
MKVYQTPSKNSWAPNRSGNALSGAVPPRGSCKNVVSLAAPPAPRALCLLCPRWGQSGACCMGKMAGGGGTRGRPACRSSQRTRRWRVSRRARRRRGVDLPARRRGEQAPFGPSPWPAGELRAGHLHGRPGQLDGGAREARVRWEAAGASGGAEDW